MKYNIEIDLREIYDRVGDEEFVEILLANNTIPYVLQLLSDELRSYTLRNVEYYKQCADILEEAAKKIEEL